MSNSSKTVFISYRREVSSFIARAIFQDLREHDYDVFMDVENIDSGTFDTIILNEIAARKHFIVILTPGTERRLAEPDDWLMREIEFAIKSKRNIVPILANNFTLSDSEQYIKDELKQLQRYNGIHLHHDYFDAAMEKLRVRFLKNSESEQVSITPETKSAVEDIQRKIEITANLPSPTKAQLNAEEYLDSGLEKYNVKNYYQAIEDYDRSIELNPEYALAYFNRGLVYKILRNKKKAIFDFLKVIEIGTDADNLKSAEVFLKELGVKL